MLLWFKAPHGLFSTTKSRDGSTGNLTRNHIAIRILVAALLYCVTTAQVRARDMADGGPNESSDRLCNAWVTRMLTEGSQKKNIEHQCGLTGPLFTGTQWTPGNRGELHQLCLANFREIYDGNYLSKIDRCVACRRVAAGFKAALETDRQWKCGLSGKVSDYASSPDPAQKLYEYCMSHDRTAYAESGFQTEVALCKHEKQKLRQRGVSARVPANPRLKNIEAEKVDRHKRSDRSPAEPCGSDLKPCKPVPRGSSSSAIDRLSGDGMHRTPSGGGQRSGGSAPKPSAGGAASSAPPGSSSSTIDPRSIARTGPVFAPSPGSSPGLR
jgi:hypothetical protein